MMTWKKTLRWIPMLALLAACSGPAGSGAVDQKRAERDSLKAEYDRIGKQLKKVEDWLALNDSTVNRNLPLVAVQALEMQPFTHYIDVHGVVKADESAALYALTGGRVASIRVKPGDRVRKGQLLITLDNDLVQKQMAQAQAAADLARTTYEKLDRLWQQQIGSEIQYLEAKANKEQAEAAVAALQEQQRLTNITAPFDGIVDDVMARTGDLASAMQPVARVVNPGGVQVQAEVSEVYVKRVKAGIPVKVTFPSIGETFTAPMEYASEYIDPANRTFAVAVRAPKGESYMRPNLLGDLQIQDSHVDSALVVPSPAVLDDVAGNSYVFILAPAEQGANVKANEAKARKVFVERVSEYQGRIHVQPKNPGELKPADRVVIEGAKNVSDGQAVLVGDR